MTLGSQQPQNVKETHKIMTQISPPEGRSEAQLVLYTNEFRLNVREHFQIHKFKISIAPEISPNSEIYKKIFSRARAPDAKESQLHIFLDDIFGQNHMRRSNIIYSNSI